MFEVFPLAGRFGAFSGRLEVPTGGAPAWAKARLDAASLVLDDGPTAADVKALHFLDVAHQLPR